jgi:hypothetical protein
MGEQRYRLRPWRPSQQSAHRPCVFFSLPSFGRGAFLTLPGAKPDDTAAERRSISASRNALAINVILKAAMASPPQNYFAPHLRSHRPRSGSACATGHSFDAIFKSELTEGAPHTLGLTAIRALRMQKDQLRVGHTIHPSDSGRRASERPPCCHKESVAAYQ